MAIYDKFTTLKTQLLFDDIYGLSSKEAAKRFSFAHDCFTQLFGTNDYRIFSAPGRCEIGGNHTDHNHGRVLAAAITCDTICFAHKRDDMQVNINSFGYEGAFHIDLNNLDINIDEYDTTYALVRGVAADMKNRGFEICGFDAYVHSTVLSGSGLSSSAALEVLMVKTISGLCGYDISPLTCALIAQFAENEYFGKPSGLMDQTASSYGSLIAIDFEKPDDAIVEQIEFDFSKSGYHLVITNTGGSHADLTHDYSMIPIEMKMVAAHYGKRVLRQVDEHAFNCDMKALRKIIPDRALLRAQHFFGENARVQKQVDAIKCGNIKHFLDMVIASGESSYKMLQNVYSSSEEQGLAIALNIAEKMLKEDGAWRVHGGGFAGTTLAFVPDKKLSEYTHAMNRVFGDNAAAVLNVRNCGAIEITT